MLCSRSGKQLALTAQDHDETGLALQAACPEAAERAQVLGENSHAPERQAGGKDSPRATTDDEERRRTCEHDVEGRGLLACVHIMCKACKIHLET